MKIKIITATVASELEQTVNKFIAQKDIDVLKMDFSTAVTGNVHLAFTVMVSYEVHGMIEEAEGIDTRLFG